MSLQDPISDFLTRLRNAQMRKHAQVTSPASNKTVAIADVLKREGYIGDFRVDGEAAKRQMTVELRYYEGRPVIEHVKRVSRPGLRIYKNHRELPSVVGGLGIAIISTSRGLMTDREARAAGIGGEVVCQVY